MSIIWRLSTQVLLQKDLGSSPDSVTYRFYGCGQLLELGTPQFSHLRNGVIIVPISVLLGR